MNKSAKKNIGRATVATLFLGACLMLPNTAWSWPSLPTVKKVGARIYLGGKIPPGYKVLTNKPYKIQLMKEHKKSGAQAIYSLHLPHLQGEKPAPLLRNLAKKTKVMAFTESSAHGTKGKHILSDGLQVTFKVIPSRVGPTMLKVKALYPDKLEWNVLLKPGLAKFQPVNPQGIRFNWRPRTKELSGPSLFKELAQAVLVYTKK